MLILRLLFGVWLAHYSIGENWILPFSAIMPFSNRITHRAHFHNFWENIQIWSNFTDCVKKTHEKPNLLFYSTQSHKFHQKIALPKNKITWYISIPKLWHKNQIYPCNHTNFIKKSLLAKKSHVICFNSKTSDFNQSRRICNQKRTKRRRVMIHFMFLL